MNFTQRSVDEQSRLAAKRSTYLHGCLHAAVVWRGNDHVDLTAASICELASHQSNLVGTLHAHIAEWWVKRPLLEIIRVNPVSAVEHSAHAVCSLSMTYDSEELAAASSTLPTIDDAFPSDSWNVSTWRTL
jgi:hypothetical protein